MSGSHSLPVTDFKDTCETMHSCPLQLSLLIIKLFNQSLGPVFSPLAVGDESPLEVPHDVFTAYLKFSINVPAPTILIFARLSWLSKASSPHHNPNNSLQADQAPKPLDIPMPHLPFVPYLINHRLKCRICEALHTKGYHCSTFHQQWDPYCLQMDRPPNS